MVQMLLSIEQGSASISLSAVAVVSQPNRSTEE